MILLCGYFTILILATLFLVPLLFAAACRLLKTDETIKFRVYFKTGLYLLFAGFAGSCLAAFIVMGLKALDVKIGWLETPLHFLFWIGLGIWIVSKNLKWNWMIGILTLVGFIVIFILSLFPVRGAVGFFAKLYSVPSGAMEDTLQVGDLVLADQLYYGHSFFNKTSRYFASHKPCEGEIVIFRYPLDTSHNFVKRCVGTPGDVVLYKNKVLYLNGVRQNEPYVKHTDSMVEAPGSDAGFNPPSVIGPGSPLADGSKTSRDNFGPVTVQPGHYFMMGDNRDNSLDSRYWGELDEKLILGKATCVFFRKTEDKVIYQPLP